jgi:hypothetical protein
MKKLLLALMLFGFISGVCIDGLKAMGGYEDEYAQEWDDELSQGWYDEDPED